MIARDQGAQNPLFFSTGPNFLARPNHGGGSPLASRAIGAGRVAVPLFSFATYIRHL